MVLLSWSNKGIRIKHLGCWQNIYGLPLVSNIPQREGSPLSDPLNRTASCLSKRYLPTFPTLVFILQAATTIVIQLTHTAKDHGVQGSQSPNGLCFCRIGKVKFQSDSVESEKDAKLKTMEYMISCDKMFSVSPMKPCNPIHLGKFMHIEKEKTTSPWASERDHITSRLLDGCPSPFLGKQMPCPFSHGMLKPPSDSGKKTCPAGVSEPKYNKRCGKPMVYLELSTTNVYIYIYI